MGNFPMVTTNSGRLLTTLSTNMVSLAVCVMVIVTLTLEAPTVTEPKFTLPGENCGIARADVGNKTEPRPNNAANRYTHRVCFIPVQSFVFVAEARTERRGVA